jgi:hypothetical protein
MLIIPITRRARDMRVAVFILVRHPAKSMTGKADGSRSGLAIASQW